ncbi:predicted protein [Plenodomus lingam JN3]|uniref:Predicted protein n=1 Tax=Leptosphaeria maculans (strain JN3 / isolate v23.1.3 / race Av1-4-5-6-7-8) TaxID=985895 RepID=E4ZNA7_LEPMJ|nr:predicted protein [Plenodomus lingam JN3]CBX92966.1 predicted protein [Plenodomus lingam JN3]
MFSIFDPVSSMLDVMAIPQSYNSFAPANLCPSSKHLQNHPRPPRVNLPAVYPAASAHSFPRAARVTGEVVGKWPGLSTTAFVHNHLSVCHHYTKDGFYIYLAPSTVPHANAGFLLMHD